MTELSIFSLSLITGICGYVFGYRRGFRDSGRVLNYNLSIFIEQLRWDDRAEFKRIVGQFNEWYLLKQKNKQLQDEAERRG